MVDLATLQAVSYIMGSLGVFVAAVYYVLNIQNNRRNQELALKAQQQTLETRRTQLSTGITERLGSKDFLRDFVELATLDWRDIDDYMKKYDSTVNTESYSQRWSVWMAYDNLGYLLHEGLVDREILFNSAGTGSVVIWGRYKPVIEHYRRTELGPRYMENFEYLAREMWEMSKVRGYISPDFKDGLTFDRYRQVFEPEPNPTP